MTTPGNPAGLALSGDEWQRLSRRTRDYVVASYELMDKAHGYLQQGDLRQASEKGWGAAAQIVKAVAENWSSAGVSHGRHQDLRTLVNSLPVNDEQTDLVVGFRAAQDLHENFYQNNAPEFRVVLDLAQTARFVESMIPHLHRSEPSPVTHQNT